MSADLRDVLDNVRSLSTSVMILRPLALTRKGHQPQTLLAKAFGTRMGRCAVCERLRDARWRPPSSPATARAAQQLFVFPPTGPAMRQKPFPPISTPAAFTTVFSSDVITGWPTCIASERATRFPPVATR